MIEINDYDEAKECWHGERVHAGDEDERREAQQQMETKINKGQFGVNRSIDTPEVAKAKNIAAVSLLERARLQTLVNVGSDVRTGQDRRVNVNQLIEQIDRRIAIARRLADRLPK